MIFRCNSLLDFHAIMLLCSVPEVPLKLGGPKLRHSEHAAAAWLMPSSLRLCEPPGLEPASFNRFPLPQQVVHTGVLKMRGLPFSATKDDIITFFDDPSFDIAPLVHDSIHIVTSIDGMLPQSACVPRRSPPPPSCSAAARGPPGCLRRALTACGPAPAPLHARTKGPLLVEGKLSSFMLGLRRRPSGVAFVEFASAEDAKTAIRKVNPRCPPLRRPLASPFSGRSFSASATPAFFFFF